MSNQKALHQTLLETIKVEREYRLDLLRERREKEAVEQERVRVLEGRKEGVYVFCHSLYLYIHL